LNHSAASYVYRRMRVAAALVIVLASGAALAKPKGVTRRPLANKTAVAQAGPQDPTPAATAAPAPAPAPAPVVGLPAPPPLAPAPSTSPRPSRPPLWFRFGERIDWSLQVRGAEGGKARLAVGQPAKSGERTILPVRGDARTSGIADSIKHVVEESTSYVDIWTTLPVVSEIRGEHGKDIVTGRVTRKDDSTAEVVTARGAGAAGPSESKQTVTIYPKTHDGLTALALLRSLPGLKEGSSRTILVYTGVKAWRLTATYSKREVIHTALGEMETFRVDGSAQRSELNGTPMSDKPAKAFTGWFSADKRRVPVLFEADSDYGKVSLVVTAYSDR